MEVLFLFKSNTKIIITTYCVNRELQELLIQNISVNTNVGSFLSCFIVFSVKTVIIIKNNKNMFKFVSNNFLKGLYKPECIYAFSTIIWYKCKHLYTSHGYHKAKTALDELGITILKGRYGTGKSTMALHLASHYVDQGHEPYKSNTSNADWALWYPCVNTNVGSFLSCFIVFSVKTVIIIKNNKNMF
jgi:hypothetical protein